MKETPRFLSVFVDLSTILAPFTNVTFESFQITFTGGNFFDVRFLYGMNAKGTKKRDSKCVKKCANG